MWNQTPHLNLILKDDWEFAKLWEGMNESSNLCDSMASLRNMFQLLKSEVQRWVVELKIIQKKKIAEHGCLLHQITAIAR